MEVTLAHLAQGNDEGRHNRRDDNGLNICHAKPLIVKQFIDQNAVFIARLLTIGRYAPMPQQFSPVIGPHNNIAVSDVQY